VSAPGVLANDLDADGDVLNHSLPVSEPRALTSMATARSLPADDEFPSTSRHVSLTGKRRRCDSGVANVTITDLHTQDAPVALMTLTTMGGGHICL